MRRRSGGAPINSDEEVRPVQVLGEVDLDRVEVGDVDRPEPEPVLRDRELDPADFRSRLERYVLAAGLAAEPAVLDAAAPLVQERSQTMVQAVELLRFLLVPETEFEVEDAAAAKQLGEAGQAVLAAAIPALDALPEWTHTAIETALQAALVDGLGLKPRHAYGPLRVAATGRTVSPPLFESLQILGRERSLARLTAAQG